jgi:hypothetical protein
MNLPEYTIETPVGSVIAYAGTVVSLPTKINPDATNLEELGWIACDGRRLEIGTFPELYEALGEKFSPASIPSGHFYLPDFQGLFQMLTIPTLKRRLRQ